MSPLNRVVESYEWVFLPPSWNQWPSWKPRSHSPINSPRWWLMSRGGETPIHRLRQQQLALRLVEESASPPANPETERCGQVTQGPVYVTTKNAIIMKNHLIILIRFFCYFSSIQCRRVENGVTISIICMKQGEAGEGKQPLTVLTSSCRYHAQNNPKARPLQWLPVGVCVCWCCCGWIWRW